MLFKWTDNYKSNYYIYFKDKSLLCNITLLNWQSTYYLTEKWMVIFPKECLQNLVKLSQKCLPSGDNLK